MYISDCSCSDDSYYVSKKACYNSVSSHTVTIHHNLERLLGFLIPVSSLHCSLDEIKEVKDKPGNVYKPLLVLLVWTLHNVVVSIIQPSL